MEYRFLGDTGLRVSALGYGFMDFTEQSHLDDMLPRAYKAGINFFDCAEGYGRLIRYGLVEELLGNSLKKLEADREDYVLTTKLFIGGKTPNKIGLSRKHLIEGANDSLKRLQQDYVDVIFAHRDDPEVPMEEIVKGFNQIIEDGQAFYWATSEWSADRIMEAFAVCDRLGMIRPIADQCEYNMIHREKMEREYVNLFEKHGYGTTVWGPLAGGILTGKYNEEIPEDSRLGQNNFFKQVLDRYMGSDKIDETRKTLRGIAEISKEAGMSMPQFSLAWLVKNKDVSTAIIGSKKPEQLEENIKAVELAKNITPEIEEKLEKVLNNQPQAGFDWKTRNPMKPRRQISTL